MANLGLYSASKAAVRAMVRGLATDLKPHGIRVNTLSPGVTVTPIMEKGLGLNDEELETLKSSIAQQAPSGRIGHPRDIAEAVYFLASDNSSYINGIELCVDGGLAQI